MKKLITVLLLAASMGATAKQDKDKSWVCVNDEATGPEISLAMLSRKSSMQGMYIALRENKRPFVQWGHGDDETAYAWHSIDEDGDHRFDYEGPSGNLAISIAMLSKKSKNNSVQMYLYDFSTEPTGEDGLWSGEEFFCSAVHKAR